MMTRSQARILLPVLVLLVAGAAYYSLVASKTERKKPVLSEKVWDVEVLMTEPQQRSPVITLYGRIESPEKLRAAAPGGGIVERVYVRDGARVGKGQQLVKLDRRDFEAALLQAEADLRDFDNQIAELEVRHRYNQESLQTERVLLGLSGAEVERLAKLKKQNLSADTALNSARSELGRQQLAVTSRQLDVDSYPSRLQILKARQDRARASLAKARLAMKRSDLKAPFEAFVSEVAVAAGDRVSLGQVLISLFPVDKLEIRAHLPINYIRSVQYAISEQLELYASVPNRGYLGRFPVLRLAGEAEATGIDVYFSIEADAGQVRPGDLLPLSLELPAETGVYAVPYQAIYGNSRMYKVVDDRLQAIDVNTAGQARDDNGRVSVLVRSNDLEPGDRIAITHLPNAVSGLKVKVDGE